ncbi:MAG: polysaccharide biosynthesis protein [Eubacteriales bacterium]|nr:polysaccharide biosynthesis protein [Eubacteriales bacterium]
MGQKNSLVRNASFIMGAAMISKVIGLLYKSPLANIVGNVGMGYVSLAQNAYMILLMIASFSIPQAVSKLIAERIAFKDYKNAQKMFRGSMIYVVFVGGLMALICLFGAKWIIPSNQPNAVLALQILSPTIFLSGILGVYRGYFQAHSDMMPTSVSQILEQIFNAIVSIVAAWALVHFVADGTEDSIAKWGAAGSTIGTSAGVVFALCFMLILYSGQKKAIRQRVEEDVTHKEESYRYIFKMIIMIVSPIILSAFIYNVNAYINGTIFSNLMNYRGEKANVISALYAEYASYFMMIINIPLTLSSAAPTSMIPEVSAKYAMKDRKGVKKAIDETVRISMFVSIPSAVGLAVLAQPIVRLLFPLTDGTAGKLMVLGSFTILLNGMSNISNAVLQAIGKPKIPMITAAVALVVDIVAVIALLMFTNWGIYTLLGAMIIYAVVICLLNDYYMKKYLSYKNPWKFAYLVPALASIPMGVVAYFAYRGVYYVVHSNLISLGISVILAVVVFLILYLVLSKPDEAYFNRLPGGRKLAVIARKMHLLK